MFRKQQPLRLGFDPQVTKPDYAREGGNHRRNLHAIITQDVFLAPDAIQALATLAQNRTLLFDHSLVESPESGNLKEMVARLTRLLLVRLQELPKDYLRRHPSSRRAARELLRSALEFWQQEKNSAAILHLLTHFSLPDLKKNTLKKSM